MASLRIFFFLKTVTPFNTTLNILSNTSWKRGKLGSILARTLNVEFDKRQREFGTMGGLIFYFNKKQ